MFNFFTSSLPGFVHAICQGNSELFMYLHSFMQFSQFKEYNHKIAHGSWTYIILQPQLEFFFYNLYRCCQKQIKITTFSVQGSVRLRVIIHSSHYFEKHITSFFLPTTTLPFIAVVTTGIIQNLIQHFKCNKMWQYFL